MPTLVRGHRGRHPAPGGEERQHAGGRRAPRTSGDHARRPHQGAPGAVQPAHNACKFTERGTVDARASRAETAAGGDWLVFAVTDTGIGMTPEQMARLFQAFSQAERRRPGATAARAWAWRSAGGSARMMGGDITVESAAGRGTRSPCACPRVVAGRQRPSRRAARPQRGRGADEAGARCWWSTTTRRSAT